MGKHWTVYHRNANVWILSHFSRDSCYRYSAIETSMRSWQKLRFITQLIKVLMPRKTYIQVLIWSEKALWLWRENSLSLPGIKGTGLDSWQVRVYMAPRVSCRVGRCVEHCLWVSNCPWRADRWQGQFVLIVTYLGWKSVCHKTFSYREQRNGMWPMC
jgi:hypothetical protein